MLDLPALLKHLIRFQRHFATPLPGDLRHAPLPRACLSRPCPRSLTETRVGDQALGGRDAGSDAGMAAGPGSAPCPPEPVQCASHRPLAADGVAPGAVSSQKTAATEPRVVQQASRGDRRGHRQDAAKPAGSTTERSPGTLAGGDGTRPFPDCRRRDRHEDDLGTARPGGRSGSARIGLSRTRCGPFAGEARAFPEVPCGSPGEATLVGPESQMR